MAEARPIVSCSKRMADSPHKRVGANVPKAVPTHEPKGNSHLVPIALNATVEAPSLAVGRVSPNPFSARSPCPCIGKVVLMFRLLFAEYRAIAHGTVRVAVTAFRCTDHDFYALSIQGVCPSEGRGD